MATALPLYQHQREEYQQRIHAEKDPVKKVKMQVDFLARFLHTSPAVYDKLLKKMLGQSKALGLKSETLECHRLMAMNFVTVGDIKAATRHVKEADKLVPLVSNDLVVGHLYRMKYILYISQGRTTEAIDSITKCIALAERTNEESLAMSAYLNLSEVTANHMQDYDRSIEYLNRSLALATKLNRPFTQSGALLYLAEMYLLKADPVSAKKKLDKALKLIEKNKIESVRLKSMLVLGTYYKDVKQYKKALLEFDKVVKLGRKLHHHSTLQFVYAKMAHIHYYMRNLDEAERYVRKSDRCGSKKQVLLENNNLRWLLSQIMAKRGDYKKAWSYLMQAERLRDETYRQETKKKIEMMSKAHQSEILEREKSIAEENARHRMDFLANVSHEIRSPMNAVLGIGNILLKRNQDNENTGYLRTIVSSSENLLGVVNDILDISKIDAGKLDIVEEPFSLTEVVLNVVAVLGYKAEEKKITLSADVHEELAPVYNGDAHRIQQVLMNLVSNAIKFTTEGGVKIEVMKLKEGKAGHAIRLKVSDTGAGMNKEQLSRIFGRFEQAEKLTTKKFGGTGLGLNISQRLTELMGGTITADSKPGKGSVFSVDMMLKPLEAPAVARNEGAHLQKLAGKTFLIADDNQVNLEVLKQTISDSLPGSLIVTVSNGQEVLNELQHRNFDFLITDLHMPVMDGLRAVQSIKKNLNGHGRMRIMALTATIAFTNEQETKNMGFDAWMSKPFREEELFQTLAALV